MSETSPALLFDDEPAAFEIFQGDLASPFLLVCDHAGKRIPQRLGSLGLRPDALETHIAWDIGAAGLAQRLAELLSAPLFLQSYSRLVIDCNRPLDAPDSIPERSGGFEIPGNQGLSEAERRARSRCVFQPYHAAIEAELERRVASQRPTILVAVHSFTPVLLEAARPWHTGLLYARDTRLAAPLLSLLTREPGLVVGDNQPYSVSETSDYAVNVYGEQRGNPYVELEIRQDLIVERGGQHEWAERYARHLLTAAATLAL